MRNTYTRRTWATLLNVEQRMHRTGALPGDVTLELTGNDAGLFVAYIREGEIWRTTSVIGQTPRDAFRWVQGFAAATFSLTEAAYMTGEVLTSTFHN